MNNDTGQNLNNTQNLNVKDAVQSNPLAFQKINSKKLEIMENGRPVVREQSGPPKSIILIIVIVLLTAIIYTGLKFIYPLFIEKSYTIDEACANPYDCTDLGNGTSSCTFYDKNDKLKTVICPNKTSTSDDNDTSDESVDITKEEVNKLLGIYLNSLSLSGTLDNLFTSGKVNVDSYLVTSEEKMKYAFYQSMENADTNKVVKNIDADGIEVENIVGIEYSFYKEYYSILFNEDFDSNILSGSSNDCVKNGYIYQDISLVNNNYLFKANKLSNIDNGYGISVDVLYFDDQSGLNQYSDYSTVDYDESLVKYNFYIEMVKSSLDTFVFTNIKENE